MKKEECKTTICQICSIERPGDFFHQQEHQDEIHKQECKDSTLQDYTIVHLQIDAGQRQRKLKIKSMVIREGTEAANTIILVKIWKIIDSNNVQLVLLFVSRHVCLEVFENTAAFLRRHRTDKITMTCFIRVKNKTKI